MKYIFTLLIIGIVLFNGCNTATKSKVFFPESLPSEQFSINTDEDTTLQTKYGALLKIPKGSLSVDGGIANLEIKEAYSIQQMMQAGLVTTSDSEPLSSGGMIYINAAGGQKITFNQPIKVAIPADYLAKDMQLFKGQKDENGKINWTDPLALPENKQLTAIDKGKVLFAQKCASCHGIGKAVTGPDLAHFPKRFPYGEGTSRYWYHYFRYSYVPVRFYNSDYTQPGDSIYENRWSDPYVCNLINHFGGPVDLYSSFASDTSDLDFFKIYQYIQSESNRLILPLPNHAYLKDCTDSCFAYKKRINDLNELKQENNNKRNQLVKENGSMVEKKEGNVNIQIIDTTTPPPPQQIDYDNLVSPQNIEAEYYQFTIESFGWFNIDILFKNIEGIEPSELFVRIRGEYRQKIQVFLIIPSLKANIEGGRTEKAEDEFAFNTKDGKIPLPQNAKAYILAMTETKTNIAFALKEFTTSRQQHFDIFLQESTIGEFNTSIQKINLDQLKIKVNESKNANEIKKTDLKIEEMEIERKKAEGLKPKGCDCDCMSWPEISNVLKRDTTSQRESLIAVGNKEIPQ